MSGLKRIGAKMKPRAPRVTRRPAGWDDDAHIDHEADSEGPIDLGPAGVTESGLVHVPIAEALFPHPDSPYFEGPVADRVAVVADMARRWREERPGGHPPTLLFNPETGEILGLCEESPTGERGGILIRPVAAHPP